MKKNTLSSCQAMDHWWESFDKRWLKTKSAVHAFRKRGFETRRTRCEGLAPSSKTFITFGTTTSKQRCRQPNVWSFSMRRSALGRESKPRASCEKNVGNQNL